MPDQNLFSLTYVSSAAVGVDESVALAIGAAAAVANGALDITGLLLFNGVSFLQTLEGERVLVEALYAHIERDERHHSVRLIHSAAIAVRTFSGFSMKTSIVPPTDGPNVVFADLICDPKRLGSELLARYQCFIVLGTAV